MIRNNPNPYGPPQYPSPPVQGGWAGRQMPAPQAGGSRQGYPPIQPGQYNSQASAPFQQPPFYRGNPAPQGYGPPFHGRPMEPPPQQPNKKGLFRNKKQKNNGQAPQPSVHAEQPQANKNIMTKLFNKKNSKNAGPPSLFSLPSGSVRETREAASRAGSASSGSFLQNLANPGAINSMLGNTQKFLQAAEAFGPVVQQYGPYLKKLPSLLNFGKDDEPAEEGMGSNGPATKAETQPPQAQVTAATAKKTADSPLPKNIQPAQSGGTAGNKGVSQGYMAGESLPKLFI